MEGTGVASQKHMCKGVSASSRGSTRVCQPLVEARPRRVSTSLLSKPRRQLECPFLGGKSGGNP